MRWSTVCGEMSSSAAISLELRCWLTSRRQSSCPALNRATRATMSSPAGPSGPLAVSGTRGHSSNAIPTRTPWLQSLQRVQRLSYFISGRICQIVNEPATNRRPFLAIRASARKAKDNGGEGWIRTSVRLRGQIYSLLPLTTRPPLHGDRQARHMAARQVCQRVNASAVATRCARALQNRTAPGRSDFGAGEGNRTLVVSLEGFCSTIELHPLWACSGRAKWPLPPASRQPTAGLTSSDSLAYHGGDDAPECHRRCFDRPLLVARPCICGAMARLID